MAKSTEAFRTISEVAKELAIPKHVLRFWEIKFPQIKPMKRGGGRRYYRPEDVELLRGIRVLLHQEGFTIRGVQKILREQGMDQVKVSGQTGTLVAVVATAEVEVAAVAPAKKSAGRGKAVRGRDDAVASVPDHLAKAIQAAIVELEACRKLLLA